MAQSEALTQVVDGGDGDDGVSAAAGDDVLIGGDGDDELFGAGGDDVVEGGSGDDALAVDGTDAAERIDLTAGGRRLDVELGTDDLDVDDVETIDALALGGADTITVGDLRRTDVERVNPALSADGAPDRVVVTGTERRDAIAVAGQAGSVTVTGLAAFVGITEAEPLDTLAIHTAAGDDAVDSSGLAPGVIGLDVE
jgi:Ca2+-binding RTX toxin-like protein